ncbi:rhodanese-like domain-containing protein [Nitrospirota bacterium]
MGVHDMLRKTLIALMALMLLSSLAWAANTGISFKVITAEDLKAEMEKGKSKVLVVDARTPDEYKQGHIPGAINLPPSKFRAIAGYLPMNKRTPLVFYCRGYNCTLSQSAATEALRAGYTDIRLFRGGFPEWAQKGYKIAK